MSERWWVALEEVLWRGDGEARGWTARFLWDDGNHWGLAVANDGVSTEVSAQWDWASGDLNLSQASLPSAVARSLRSALKECSPRALNPTERKVLDHVAIETLTSSGRTISGQALRHWGRQESISEAAIDAAIQSLMPRFVEVIPPGESELYFATLGGLLRSDRSRDRSSAALGQILSALRMAYDANPDLRSLKVGDLGANAIVSDARVIMNATKLSTDFDRHAWQLVRGRELESAWKNATSLDRFLDWIRTPDSGRPWSTAPLKLPVGKQLSPGSSPRVDTVVEQARFVSVTFGNLNADAPEARALVEGFAAELEALSIDVSGGRALALSGSAPSWLEFTLSAAAAAVLGQLTPVGRQRIAALEQAYRSAASVKNAAFVDGSHWKVVAVEGPEHSIRFREALCDDVLANVPTLPAYIRAWGDILDKADFRGIDWELRGTDWFPLRGSVTGEAEMRAFDADWWRIEEVRVAVVSLASGANAEGTHEHCADYDVAFSFAGEDRKYVDQVANVLNGKVRVFYDQFDEAKLWGANLIDAFSGIYSKRSRYCVMFISKHYATKAWTTQERQTAQAHAFTSRREFILPARFDDTVIPGVLPTVGYIDLRKRTPEEFAALIEAKLKM